MKTNQKQNQYKTYERNGQLVLALNSEIMIPDNAPVRLTSAQLEEVDYSELYRAYSPVGRKSAADARVMFQVLVYGYQCGIYSSRKLEEACRYRIDDNYLYLDGNGQSCFIKPTNYEQKKSQKFRKQIGRIENMTYDAGEDCFFCAQREHRAFPWTIRHDGMVPL